MSKSNPKKAIDAILPLPIDLGGGVKVLPLSLGHYALLEKIDSPLLWTREQIAERSCDALTMIPSLYVVTRPVRDTLADFDDLLNVSLTWAESLTPDMLGKIRNAVAEQISRMLRVIPEPSEGKKKAGTTAG